ncbi:TPA: hypothetical protein ACLIVW_006081, partial [Pseudomonas aeruginosa]
DVTSARPSFRRASFFRRIPEPQAILGRTPVHSGQRVANGLPHEVFMTKVRWCGGVAVKQV